MERKTRPLVIKARDLYAAGRSYEQIADALGRTTGTIKRWAREDKTKGDPWRPASQRNFEATMSRLLESRLDALMSAAAATEKAEANRGSENETILDLADTRLEDRALKLCKLLEFLRSSRDDPTPALETMQRFAVFAKGRLVAPELRIVRKAIRLFLDELRKDYE